MLHADTHILVYAVKEQAILELQHLLLTLDVAQDNHRTLVGIRHKVVHQEETANGDEECDDDEWLHNTHQRHTCRLHCLQLEVLAHITHCHNSRQQHRKWQTQRNHIDCGIEDKLQNDICAESLACQILNKSPHEVHHQHECDDEKGHNQRAQICLEDKFMNGFHIYVAFLYCAKIVFLWQ